MNEIRQGDKVRSFDFPFASRDVEGERACFVEGEVVAIVHMQGCDRYEIRCSRRVFRGEAVTPEDEMFYPPINGTPTLFGGNEDGVTDCVEKVEG